MTTHKHEKIGEIGYLYRGLLIAKRDSWATWTPKYTLQDVTENILFASNPENKTFISIPITITLNGFATIKDAKKAIDTALDSFTAKIEALRIAAIRTASKTELSHPLIQLINEIALHAKEQHGNVLDLSEMLDQNTKSA